jgi:hypothetical protein
VYNTRMLELRAPIRAAPVMLPSWARGRLDIEAIAAGTLTFALVLYLSLNGGGYDIVPRSDAGEVVWWIVLLGAAGGLLPARFGRRGWIAVALLAGFGLWTGLAIGWSQSAEQSVVELGRIAAYLGVLVLALGLLGRTSARPVIAGLTCAIALVTVLSVLSRLDPHLFTREDHFQFLSPASARKLSYPLGYWNALADFAAIGVPLLLAAAVGSRRIVAQAAAAATLPLSALCIYLTVSRGGAIALGLGVAVYLLVTPRRLETFATLLVAGAGAALLLRAAAARPAVTGGTATDAAFHQGAELLGLSAIVCIVVALLQVAIGLAARNLERPAILTPDRRSSTRRWLVVAAAALVVAVAAGMPGTLAHAWDDFKQPNGVVTPGNQNSVFSRLQAANGNGRYQIWQAALHANATHPWIGIGPGTFQFWWTQHPTAQGFIRNAHSLYLETLAETGIVGLALLGGLLLWFVAVAILRALSEPPPVRLWLAGVAAAFAVFLFSAAVEWVWQLAAIAATALILGAVIIAGRDDGGATSAEPPARPRLQVPAGRLAVAALSLAALGAIIIPLAGQLAVRASQRAAAAGRLGTALEDSLAAVRLQPYASSAHLQEALVLEQAGDLAPAATAAREAASDSPTDWTTWLTLARIEARRGADAAALAALREARRLNPGSTLFGPE